MSNICKDLSNLTTIPEKKLVELFSKINYIICQTIEEDMKENKTVSEFNFNCFKLYINHEDPAKIKYKTIPNKELQENVKETVNGKLNLLQDKLNAALAQKFLEVYKDIC